ncbi:MULTISPECIES: hypothetical protein [unclassified Bradyrhizobium]|uniref:hypothetical protein n=1 Tax=unclassified Bradyrhizobium TaxID=2631580 RepID=UPI0028ED047F|nr:MULTISPECIES: hypothetical protein [unclassified Bradyrhizobium]
MSRKPETAIQARFGDVLFEKIEHWRRLQPKIPPLADTVRFLVSRGLEAEASDGEAGIAPGAAAPRHTAGAGR